MFFLFFLSGFFLFKCYRLVFFLIWVEFVFFSLIVYYSFWLESVIFFYVLCFGVFSSVVGLVVFFFCVKSYGVDKVVF